MPFIGQWCLETKTWKLVVLLVVEVYLFIISAWKILHTISSNISSAFFSFWDFNYVDFTMFNIVLQLLDMLVCFFFLSTFFSLFVIPMGRGCLSLS